jgi:sugar transferase EpsL
MESAPARSRTKRAFDVVVSIVLLFVTLPLFICVSVIVRATLGSPVLFRQLRPGLKGRQFELFKFRTMRSSSLALHLPDDQRLTVVGRVLRRTSLDELPELINVLRGEMSMVGPRPLLPQYEALYTPSQRRRHETRPGLTGLAQISGRNALEWNERLRLDVEYIDTWNMRRDLYILFRTIGIVLSGKGVSQRGHATMSEFTGQPDSAEDSARS